MKKDYDIVCDEEVVNDILNILNTGHLAEQLDTLDFVSSCFHKDEKMLKVLVDVCKNKDNPVLSNRAKELFIGNMESFIKRFVVKHYPTFVSMHFEDMVQAARMGILIGLEKYEPQVSKPSTYFVVYIKHEISYYIDNYVNGLSTYYANEKYKLKKAISQLERENESITDLKLSQITGISYENILSLKNTPEVANNVPYEEVLLNEMVKEESPEEIAIKNELTELIDKAVNSELTVVEQKIIGMYYGLGKYAKESTSFMEDNSRRAFKYIANTLNISCDEVVKKHASALRKLYGVVKEKDIISEIRKVEKILDTEWIVFK